MRETQKFLLRSLIALSFVSAFAAASANAQNRDARFISARAGGVNFVARDVTARRAGEKDWQRLSVKDDLKSGDTVRTGADGRVEVLLNPGSYLRAGAGTEFTLDDASLDNLQVTLSRGSAVVEATGYDNLDLSIDIVTPQAHVHLVRSGVYRLNVLPSGTTELAVYKGRALVGEAAVAIVTKSGNTIRLGVGGAEAAKLDKNDRDALDDWSRERGKELAKVNESLVSKQTNTLFARASFNGLFPSNYGYGGVWAWSGGLGCYTFLPFAWGWASPYGFGYGSFWSNGFSACGCGYNPYRRSSDGGVAYTSTPNRGSNPPWGTTPGGGTTTGGGRTPAPPPPPQPPPTRDVPSRSDVDRPMPERSREPGTRP
jgi:hypothetical protein